MRSPSRATLAALLVVPLIAAACTQSAPAPTAAPAPTVAPAKAAAPAQVSTAAPAAVPVKKVDFPAKGMTVTFINPWGAGGGIDIGARILAPIMEKELGVPVQIVNKVGASGQIGIGMLATSKPDGYTIGYTPFPGTIAGYLDPESKTPYGRRDFEPLAMQVVDPTCLGVASDSPYKSVKDLIDDAKANPGRVKYGTTGIFGDEYFAQLEMERLVGSKLFAPVHFDSSANVLSALLGGHIDLAGHNVGDYLPQVKAGQIRVLAVLDNQESKFLPGVKTLESQGIKLNFSVYRGISAPAGTPKEIVDILAAAVKKGVMSDQHMSKMEEMGQTVLFMGPEEFEKTWTEVENMLKPLVPLVRAQ